MAHFQNYNLWYHSVVSYIWAVLKHDWINSSLSAWLSAFDWHSLARTGGLAYTCRGKNCTSGVLSIATGDGKMCYLGGAGLRLECGERSDEQVLEIDQYVSAFIQQSNIELYDACMTPLS